MHTAQRQIASFFLLAFVVGGLLAPLVHRVQHAETWEDLEEAWSARWARGCAHGGHDDGWLIDDKAYDPPACTLCAGVLHWGLAPASISFTTWVSTSHADRPVAAHPHLSVHHLSIRGPPAFIRVAG